MTLCLNALTPEQLALETSMDLDDARRIIGHVCRTGRLPESGSARIRRRALERARELGSVRKLELVVRERSALDPFIKFAFALDGGETIETVLWPLEKPNRFSVCVSSQCGCALGCAFCATGQAGFRKNLEAWQIVEQVRIAREELTAGQHLRTVVFQGMGEPLANFAEVVQAIRVFGEPAAYAIEKKGITVCTAGLPDRIRQLADEVPDVRLALSIGSTDPAVRRRLMPIEQTFPLTEALGAARDHAARTGRAPMFSYTLLLGINDSEEDARGLARLALEFAEAAGQKPRLSVIPYNEVAGAPFERAPAERLAAFRKTLHDAGVGTTLRYSGGGDIGAACGQLGAALMAASGR